MSAKIIFSYSPITSEKGRLTANRVSLANGLPLGSWTSEVILPKPADTFFEGADMDQKCRELAKLVLAPRWVYRE